MSVSFAPEARWSPGLGPRASLSAYEKTAHDRGKSTSWTAAGLLEDAVFLLFAVLLLPVAILAVGAPLALLVGLLLRLAGQM